MTEVDLRCPVTPRRLFARWRTDGRIVDGNLIEVACDDCKAAARRMGQPDVALVLHRFNVLGECVESEVRRRTPAALHSPHPG